MPVLAFFAAAVSFFGCQNPVLDLWIDSPPPVIRVANPTNQAKPCWTVDTPGEPTGIVYSLRQWNSATDEQTFLVDETTLLISEISTFDSVADWNDKANSPEWALISEKSVLCYRFSDSLAEGPYAYVLSVKSSFGESTSETVTRQTVIDLTPPDPPDLPATITVDPGGGNLSWSGPDDAITAYQISWDSDSIMTVPCAYFESLPSASYSLPPDLHSGDTHTLSVQAVDRAGNVSDPVVVSISVSLDDTLPVFPTTMNVSQTADPYPTWNWIAPANVLEVRYRITRDGESFLDWITGEVDPANPEGSYGPTTPLLEGEYTMEIQAYSLSLDAWSESNIHTITVHFCLVDAPEVQGLEITNSLSPTFSWPFQAEAASYRYQVNGQSDDNWSLISLTDLESHTVEPVTYYDFTLPVSLVTGMHTIYIQGMDTGEVWSISGSFSFLIETDEPTVTLFGVYSDEATRLLGEDLERAPVGAYLKVRFSEPMDIDADTNIVLMQIEPDADIILTATDVSAEGDATQFNIAASGEWDGRHVRFDVRPALSDIAGNELDPGAGVSVEFDVAVRIDTVNVAEVTPDGELRNAIAAYSGLTYIHEIETLDLVGNTTVANLAGIENFSEIRSLKLSGCTGINDTSLIVSTGEGDVNALSLLTVLGYLDISDTNITDISFVSELPRLSVLNASKNETVLGEGYDTIDNLAGMGSISGLRMIDLSGNGLDNTDSTVGSALSPQESLRILVLSDNPSLGSADLSFLSSALPLLEVLIIDNCGIGVLDLSNQTQLQDLSMSGNSGLTSLTGISSKDYRYLTLRDTGLTNLGFLSSADGIEELDLSGTPLGDLSGLTGVLVSELVLAGCELDDVEVSAIVTEPATTFTDNLNVLDLSGNQLTDFTLPAGFYSELINLDLSDNEITGCAIPADALTKLAILSLTGNSIVDVSPLAVLSNVETLDLSGNLDVTETMTTISPITALEGVAVGTQTHQRGGLTESYTYTFGLRAADSTSTTNSNGITAVVVPSSGATDFEIGGLITAPGDGQVMLSWTDPSAADFDHAFVRWKDVESVNWSDSTSVAAATQTATITGLDNGVLYLFRVCAVFVDASESAGLISTAVPAVPVMSDVTGLSITISAAGQVDFDWIDPEDGNFDHVDIWIEGIRLLANMSWLTSLDLSGNTGFDQASAAYLLEAFGSDVVNVP